MVLAEKNMASRSSQHFLEDFLDLRRAVIDEVSIAQYHINGVIAQKNVVGFLNMEAAALETLFRKFDSITVDITSSKLMPGEFLGYLHEVCAWAASDFPQAKPLKQSESVNDELPVWMIPR